VFYKKHSQPVKTMKLKKIALLALAYSINANSSDSYDIRLYIDGIRAPEISTPTVSDPALEPNPSDWIRFFRMRGVSIPSHYIDFSTAAEDKLRLRAGWTPAVTDSMLPQGTLGTERIYSLDFDQSDISHVNFMRGVKYVDWLLELGVTKNLKSLDGLQDLVGAYQIELMPYDEGRPTLLDISGLKNLKFVDNIWLKYQTKIVDFTPLSGVIGSYTPSRTAVLHLQMFPFELTSKLMWNTPVCQAMKNKKVIVSFTHYKIRMYASNSEVISSPYPGSFCKSGDFWIDAINIRSRKNWPYLFTEADLPDPYSDSYTDATLDLGAFEFGSKAVTENTFPGPQLPERFSGYTNILLSRTELTNLNLLGGLNKITNLTMEQSTKLTDITALRKFSKINNFTVTYAPLKSLSGLENLISAGTLNFERNSSLVDLSALSGLQKADRILMRNFTGFILPSKGSDFCSSSQVPDIELLQTDGSYKRLEKSTFCN